MMGNFGSFTFLSHDMVVLGTDSGCNDTLIKISNDSVTPNNDTMQYDSIMIS